MTPIVARTLQNGFAMHLLIKSNLKAHNFAHFTLLRSYFENAGFNKSTTKKFNDRFNNHYNDTINYNKNGSTFDNNNNYRSNRNYNYRSNRNSNYRSNDNFGNRKSYLRHNNNNHNNSRNFKNSINTNPKNQFDGDIRFQPDTLNKLTQLPDQDLSNNPVTLDSLLNDKIIANELYESINSMNFTSLTKVQQLCIKQLLNEDYINLDMITRAKTGTGKTFAFLIPIFQHLINLESKNLSNEYRTKNKINSIIIVPTRDLAFQIKNEIDKIYQNNKNLRRFKSVVAVGGTNYNENINKLFRLSPSILIATPGRLQAILDEFGEKFFTNVDIKVLDEADRLLDIGFSDSLNQMSERLNQLSEIGSNHIKTWLYSATLDQNVQKLSSNIMNKEKCLFIDTVDKNEPEAHESIEQSLVETSSMGFSIIAALDHILKTLQNPELQNDYKTIIFTPTIKSTIFISQLLQSVFRQYHIKTPVLEFHGRVSQNRRTNLVNKFKLMNHGIFVCTDVAARGMDFPNIKEVLQIGVPNGLSNYIHRIGRTARSGKTGKSIIYLAGWEKPFIQKLKQHKNVTIANATKFDHESETGLKTLQDDISRLVENYDEILTDCILSLVSFYQTCMTEYQFNSYDSMIDISKIYGVLNNKPDIKLPLSNTRLLSRIGLNSSLVREMIDVVPRKRYQDNNNESKDYENDDSYDSSYNKHNFRKENSFNSRRNNNYNRYKSRSDWN